MFQVIEVLIPVLMEYPLTLILAGMSQIDTVLIPVLMEYPLTP